MRRAAVRRFLCSLGSRIPQALRSNIRDPKKRARNGLWRGVATGMMEGLRMLTNVDGFYIPPRLRHGLWKGAST